MRDRLSWRAPSSRGIAPGMTSSTNSGAHVSIAIHNATVQDITVHVHPNTIYTAPFIVSNSLALDTAILDIATAGSYALVGLYQVGCATDCLPYALHAQTAAMSVGATGPRTADFTATCRDRTLWWTAVLAISSVALDGVHDEECPAIFGYDGTSLSQPYCAVVASWAYTSGLPTTFPTSFTYVGSGIPTVGFAVSAIG
jgi:hypothetical protein